VALTEKQRASNDKYIKAHYERLPVSYSKEFCAQVRAAAAQRGMSLAGYVRAALEEYERPHHGARLDGESNTMRNYMQSVQTDTETE
jgi:hypothetical protein